MARCLGLPIQETLDLALESEDVLVLSGYRKNNCRIVIKEKRNWLIRLFI
jgi:hypothetical protein